ncbi:MAG: T9SS type A sorting domain-containing protein [Candidatus Aegiribacteria sp.]|nr:T9SS type A sorting domain-containing protein [Candidatus Aegiribacteria sp.]
MKKYSWLLCIIVVIPVQAAWNIEVINDYDGGYTSIALDSEGNPHISHGIIDLWYVYYNGDQWFTECLETEETSMHTCLVLDQWDHPHITYRYGMSGDYQLKYAHWTGSEWLKTVVENSDGGYTSIALDSMGEPHIVCQLSSGLLYARWAGSEWEKETVDPDCWEEASSIALDDSGYPHIAYVYRNDYLKLASWDGSQWNFTLIDSGTTLDCEQFSLVLDEYQNPRVAYVNSPNVKYTYFDGSQWHFEVAVQDCGTPLTFVSMRLDDSGEPHLVCTDPLSCSVVYSSRDSGSWSSEVIDNGYCVSLALSEEMLARIAFGIGIDGVKYAEEYETGIFTEDRELSSFLQGPSPNPTHEILNLMINLENCAHVGLVLYDLTGRVVLHKNFSDIDGGSGQLQLDLNGVSSGTYLCRVTALDRTESRLVTVIR